MEIIAMTTRRSNRLAVWLGALACALLTGVHLPAFAKVATAPADQQAAAQQPPQTATPPPAGAGGRGEGGGGGRGGPPPMTPIDENAPLPPLATPGKLVGEPPSDAVVLFNGTDISQWTLRDGSPAKCKVEKR